MTNAEFSALLPLVVLASTAVVVMLLISVKRDLLPVCLAALAGFTGSFATLFVFRGSMQVTPLLIMDDPARFFIGALLAAHILIVPLSYDFIRRLDENREEFFLLLVLATLGASVLASSSHFASLFLGLEILSVSLYGLLAYNRSKQKSIEGGIKYLFATSVSSAVLLFGIALLYAETGTMEVGEVSAAIAARANGSVLVPMGLSMILIGFSLKLALVPFHMWIADIYQGAIVPSTSSIATVSKVSVLALFYRYFVGLGLLENTPVGAIVLAIVAASMLAGNWLSLLQTNVKRLLAYSSISQVAYLLIPFFSYTEQGKTALFYSLTAYFLATAGSFGVVAVLSAPGEESEEFADFRGLSSTKPWLAAAFTAMLLSLAGIPLTMGFTGKLYLFVAATGSERWFLAVLLLVSSAIGLFYYFRLVSVMFAAGEQRGRGKGTRRVSVAEGAALLLLVVLLVFLGVYPAPFLGLIQATIPLPA